MNTSDRPAFLTHRPSLRRDVTRGLGIILIVALLLLAFGITFFVYETERESWATRLDEAAVSAAQTVQVFMDQVNDSLSLIGLVDSDYLRQDPRVLQDLLDQLPALLEIIRLDASGRILAGAYQDAPVMGNRFTIPQSTWFGEAKQGHTYVGRVEISAQNEPYLIMAVPTSEGGVVAARLRMDVLWQVVSDIQFGKTGQAYVVNGQGVIVAHPDPAVVLAFTRIDGRPELASALQAAERRRYDAYTNFAGVDVVGYTAAIQDNDWTIFAEISRSEAFAITTRALLILGGGVLLFGTMMFLEATRLIRRLVFMPLESLRDGADRIGRGDLKHRIAIVQGDEIGQVAEAFNDMATRLDDRESALEHARDEALEASSFKSRLLANVSHDLRTPLSAILGYADMLQEGVYGPLEARQQRVIQRVLSNAKRLLSLINSLLDQAQIEAGTLKLRKEEFVPATLLTEVLSVMGIVAEAKGLELTTSIAPDLPSRLVGDPQRLLQILENLIENAIKFTAAGSVGVLFSRCEDGRWAMEVSDTGPGIPVELRDQIFEPFRRGEDAPSREHNGLGLGLSIVQQLALLMGGEVRLISELGQGSRFSVILPLAVREEKGA